MHCESGRHGSEKITHKDTEQHVAEVDESLGTDHTLPEVKGSLHLRHELDEKHGTAIRVDGLHKSNDLALESNPGIPISVPDIQGLNKSLPLRWTSSCYYGPRVDHVGGAGSRVIRERVCCDGHRGNDDDDVQPDGKIRQVP